MKTKIAALILPLALTSCTINSKSSIAPTKPKTSENQQSIPTSESTSESTSEITSEATTSDSIEDLEQYDVDDAYCVEASYIPYPSKIELVAQKCEFNRKTGIGEIDWDYRNAIYLENRFISELCPGDVISYDSDNNTYKMYSPADFMYIEGQYYPVPGTGEPAFVIEDPIAEDGMKAIVSLSHEYNYHTEISVAIDENGNTISFNRLPSGTKLYAAYRKDQMGWTASTVTRTHIIYALAIYTYNPRANSTI